MAQTALGKTGFGRPFATTLLAIALAGCAGAKPTSKNGTDAPAAVKKHTEMTLYMLATCPHCARALRHAILPLYQEMKGALTLNVEYLGTVNENGLPDLGHGEREVESAKIELCAANVASEAAWFEFMGCLYEDTLWEDIPANWKKCAKAVNIPVADIAHCADKGGGEAALMRSIATSAAEGIQAAPTLVVDAKEYVGPIDRASLLTHICYFAGKPSTRPAMCNDVDEPKALHAIVLNDMRCGDKCDIAREVEFIQALFPAMEMVELDYSEPDGKKLYDQIRAEVGDGTVPVLYIQETMDDLGHAAIPLAQYMVEFENGFLLPMGEGIDPTREICSNNADDDGNGQVDCEDAACAGTLQCRPEIKNRMDLFIMSQCPFAAMVIPAADHVVKHLTANGSSATFRFQFIGDVENGTLYSMHGESEVNEDLRMACVQELYPENHAFMSYLLCRAGNYRSDDWQKCLSENMVEADVQKCAGSAQGYDLMTKSFNMAKDVEMQASPSWLLNNHTEMNARTATDIFDAYCAANDDPACEVDIKPLLIDKKLPDVQQCGE
ncbi:MAG: thioredoxin domain-containing protein [Deltaproteobacteria bacterium]|nr:thioredoxin domain-containing protein [Deltaproteobacteria bacterium]